MDRSLGRKDTTKGPPLRILSLDGGGVRGYSMLIIIQELMHRIYVETHGQAPRRDQIPKPCNHFDLICGTGTGGLIAIMLGRLRLDLETCKEVYVRMTRKVFETDKTIAGIPYRSTLFKASKLEEAIKECVREHTVHDSEGNDASSAGDVLSPMTPFSPNGKFPSRHSSNASVLSFSNRSPSTYARPASMSSRWGDSNALLYDSRENRTKTAVTAVYKGTPKGSPPAFLRSYDSRKEPAPETNCTIWQAGRATSATGLAFKPIQMGQSVFIDEGAGQYNPSMYVLDEACINEWPGRDVGCFISIGSGKRPAGSDHNQHLWYEGFMGEFAEARRKLISKIEGCEIIHQRMIKEHLAKRGVSIDNYYRLNVEIGVGEFGMNEWNRLADISTGTRRYLGKSDVQRMMNEASSKAAKIYFAKQRLDRAEKGLKNPILNNVYENEYPTAIELPAEVPVLPLPASVAQDRLSYDSGGDHLPTRPSRDYSPRSSEHVQTPPGTSSGSIMSGGSMATNMVSEDKFVVSSPTPAQWQTAEGADKIAIMSLDEQPRPLHSSWSNDSRSASNQHETFDLDSLPPPLPPKTPFEAFQKATEDGLKPRPQSRKVVLPYPVDDAPPVANMARKPKYEVR